MILINEYNSKRSAGEGIRTLEGLRQRILSPPPLTAWVPLQLYYGFAVPLKNIPLNVCKIWISE
jgi:hypothetical protein